MNLIRSRKGVHHSGPDLARKSCALEIQDVASFIGEFLLQCYPRHLLRRYDIDRLPPSDIELLEAIARKRGCIVSGGRVDLEKVSRLLINELRNGELGPICLETPESYADEMRQVEIAEAEKQTARKQRTAARRK